MPKILRHHDTVDNSRNSEQSWGLQKQKHGRRENRKGLCTSRMMVFYGRDGTCKEPTADTANRPRARRAPINLNSSLRQKFAGCRETTREAQVITQVKKEVPMDSVSGTSLSVSGPAFPHPHNADGASEGLDTDLGKRGTKRKRVRQETQVPVFEGNANCDEEELIVPEERLTEIATHPVKTEKERQRIRQKKKRQKTTKQVKAEEERFRLENEARQAESSSSGPCRFLVRVPLARISDLAGRSVCKNFRKPDLDLNEIRTVQLDSIRDSPQASSVFDCLRRPLYFEKESEPKLEELKMRLGNANVCSKLRIRDHSRSSKMPESKRITSMGSAVVDAIVQVLQESGPPHELESSQNSEEKIKALFKPVLRSIGFDDVLVTTGFSWRESIGLRSTIDLGTHSYSPRSDVAIVQVLSKQEAKILIVFEAYSRLGQSLKTPDENRADRVRLLIQASYISRKDSRPAVVFYLTQDKHMETIIVFPKEECEKTSYMYYAERLPFYMETTWVDLICQVVNLVQELI